MVKVDYDQIDLQPPVGGGAGLPLTIRWMDIYQNTPAPTAGTAKGWPIFDSSLWADPSTHAAVGPGGASTSQPQLITANVGRAAGRDFTDTGFLFKERANASEGNLLTLQPPTLNHQWGTLDSNQLIQTTTASRGNANAPTNAFSFMTPTSTELGRFVGLGRRIRTDNPRPGNASWTDEMFAESVIVAGLPTTKREIRDIQIGYDALAGVGFNGLDFTFAAQGYHSSIAYPSGGFGAMWDNYHDSGFALSLGCSTYDPTALVSIAPLYSEGGINDALSYIQFWAVNELTFRRPTGLGSTPSGQQGWRTLTDNTTLATTGAKELFIDGPYSPVAAAGAGQPDYVGQSNTIQNPAVYDKQSTIAHDSRHNPAAAPGVYSVGRPDLGNSVVMDTAGLIGFEGFITATAFSNVSLNANSDGDDATAVKTYYNGQTYGGLNIQVHSGAGGSRNGASISDSIPTILRYGSDGAAVQPMTDALKTSASRKINDGGATLIWEPVVDSNKTTFFNVKGTVAQTGGSATPIGENSFKDLQGVNPSCEIQSHGLVNADRLLGDDHTTGTTWDGTNKLTCAWMAEKLPTRVQIIPSKLRPESRKLQPMEEQPQSQSRNQLSIITYSFP